MDWLVELDTVVHSCLDEVAANGVLQIEAAHMDNLGAPRVAIRGRSFSLEISLHHGEFEGYIRPIEQSVGRGIELRCLVGTLLGNLPAASNGRAIIAGLAQCVGIIESAVTDSDQWAILADRAEEICSSGTHPDSRSQDPWTLH